MMAVLFRDLQEKQFISHCSKDTTSLEGKGRHTEHHEKIKHPQLAEQCLQMAAGIDIHNYARACSSGLCDVCPQKTTIISNFQEFLVSHLAIPSSSQYILPKTLNRNLLMKYVMFISK